MTIFRGVMLLIICPLVLFAAGLSVGRLAVNFAMEATPEPATLLEAVEIKANDAIYRFVAGGEDPGRVVMLDHPWRDLRKGDPITPLLLGVARGNTEQVAFLLKRTNSLGTPPNDQVLCFVARYGRGDMVDMLFVMGFARTPKDGCDGHGKQPEQVAIETKHENVAKRLEAYRTKFPTLDQRDAELHVSRP